MHNRTLTCQDAVGVIGPVMIIGSHWDSAGMWKIYKHLWAIFKAYLKDWWESAPHCGSHSWFMAAEMGAGREANGGRLCVAEKEIGEPRELRFPPRLLTFLQPYSFPLHLQDARHSRKSRRSWKQLIRMGGICHEERPQAWISHNHEDPHRLVDNRSEITVALYVCG